MDAVTVKSVEDQLLERLYKSSIKVVAGSHIVVSFQRASALTKINSSALWQELRRMIREKLVQEGVHTERSRTDDGEEISCYDYRTFDLTAEGRALYERRTVQRARRDLSFESASI